MSARDADWNASAYHRVSAPQTAWGLEVLDRLRLRGDETVLDAGCGPGKLTAVLAARLDRGRVLALDSSPQMLAVARRELARFGSKVELIQATLPDLPLPGAVDAIVSTATLHWVLDHPALFRAFRDALRPGGQLELQCGGAGNLHRFHSRALGLAATPEFRDAFLGWTDPWCLADAEVTAGRLAATGLVEVRAWLEPRPTHYPSAAAFADFTSHVVLRPFLARLEPERARRFTELLTDAAGRDEPPYVLDYIRLNASARAPGGVR
ncbi:MAG TPA: methyltransferase domain-containing protein [Myxococcaceae bacterium]|nr:methyltransferase domain-containing protein [Myxococcaceae bacterium]